MRNASKSQHQGLRTCSWSFSLKSNGHGVIVDGARGFYFGSNFEGCKRFWGDYNITVSYGPLIKNEGCIKKPTSRATHLQSEFFAQIKPPRSYRQWRERLLFWFEFRRMQAVLGGLKYIHELWSPDKKWGMHQKSQHQGLRTCSRSFSLKSNGHGVIVDGARGLYFGLNFEGCKRFWED